MKDVATVLVTMLVLLSLIALLTADYRRDSTRWVLIDDRDTITEASDRFALQR